MDYAAHSVEVEEIREELLDGLVLRSFAAVGRCSVLFDGDGWAAGYLGAGW